MIDEDEEAALKFIEERINAMNKEDGRGKMDATDLDRMRLKLKQMNSNEGLDKQVLEQISKTLAGFLLQPKGALPQNAEVIREMKLAVQSFSDDKPLRKGCEHWVGLLERHYPGTTVYNVGALLGEQSPLYKQLREEADALSLDVCILYAYLKFGEKLGLKFKLYENIYKTYAAGAWPCGWVGKYPDGHILVYWPFKEEPMFENAPEKPK